MVNNRSKRRLRYKLPSDIPKGEIVFNYQKPEEESQFPEAHPLTIFDRFDSSNELYYGRTLLLSHPQSNGSIAVPKVFPLDVSLGLENLSRRFYVGKDNIINAFRSIADFWVYSDLLRQPPNCKYHNYLNLLYSQQCEINKSIIRHLKRFFSSIASSCLLTFSLSRFDCGE